MPNYSFAPRRTLLLWNAWWRALQFLRPACRRSLTFLWLATALAALCLRPDLAGVTSLVRSLGLLDACYDRLLHFFHSAALPVSALTACWLQTVRGLFARRLVRVQGRPVVIVDGLKRPKEGRKMPAVKRLYQESTCNAKPPFIMGHSCQVIALLVRAAGTCFGVPIASRIHEGVVWSNAHRRSLLDKLSQLILGLDWTHSVTVVADAYYAAGKFARSLLDGGHHLVTRVRSNAVAYHPAPCSRKHRRGRPRLYGHKSKLKHYFRLKPLFQSALSPVYDDRKVTLRYYTRDLVWRPVRQLVRFVWVIHPTRGKLILMTTDLKLSPLEIIQLYGWRFKIEQGFKQAIHTIGAYAYHFWMRAMTPIRRGSGNQYLHRKTDKYRHQVRRKLAAYERHIQIGLIAQGLLQYLAVNFQHAVWRNYASYLRTTKPDCPPSEWVVTLALRNTWHDFLRVSPASFPFKKFLASKLDLKRCRNHEAFQLDQAA
jgi:DDE superfamily endonuclease